MEKTFNVNGGGHGEWSLGKVVLFLLDACQAGSEYRVTVRVEPLPERVKWPWPDVRRVRVGVRVPGSPSRPVEFMSSAGWELMGDYEWSLFGNWPWNESRIASNDNGFVRLSEVPDAK